MFVLSLVNRNVQAWDPRYVENDYDTLANSYLVTMAVYRWPRAHLLIVVDNLPPIQVS